CSGIPQVRYPQGHRITPVCRFRDRRTDSASRGLMHDSTPAQIALVTGASAGFGRAICERFLRDGYRVIAAARRMERLLDLQQRYGDAVLPVALDVRDEQAIADMKASLPEGWRDIDILVNNAGLALGTEKAQEALLQDWRTMIDTNITGDRKSVG